MAGFSPTFTFSHPGEPFNFASVEKVRTAEIGDRLRDQRFPVHARKLKRWFRRHTSLEEFLNSPELAAVATPQEIQAVFSDLLILWNYTPFPALIGRRPAELYMEAVSTGRDPDDPNLLEVTRFVPEDTIVDVWTEPGQD